MIIYDIVGECLMQHEGGEEFFDALDERIRSSDVLMRAIMSKAIFNDKVPFDAIIVSGKFGTAFSYLCSREYPMFTVMKVRGSLRGDDILTVNDYVEYHLRNKRVIFIDDSFYSGKTRNKIETALINMSSSLEATYVIYDGSKVKEDSVYSLYRYYDHH